MVTISFVKGHMGGDEVVLLDGRQIARKSKFAPPRVLMAPNVRGREVAVLYPPKRGGDISVKVYNLTTAKPIKMCGGLTQVLGVALAQTDMSKWFSLKVKAPRSSVRLETDSGIIPIEITFVKDDRVIVRTEMKSYVEKCYEQVTEETTIEGISMERVGEYYFSEFRDLKKKYPGIDFTRNNRQCLEIFERMRKERKLGEMYAVVVNRGLKPGNMYGAFRFAPPDGFALEGEEFACGTGATTLALREFSHKRLPVDRRGRVHFCLRPLSRGIFSADLRTEVELQVRNSRVTNAWFSHNYVKIVAEGKLRL